MLAPWRVSRHPTEDHHDGAIFPGKFIMLDVLRGASVVHVLWLVPLANLSLHEVAILHGMLD
jgi:hypothetical protein